MPASQFKGSPDPFRGGVSALDLNFLHTSIATGNHRIEKLWTRDGKQKERELPVWQELEAVYREPNGVGQTNINLVLRRDKRQSAEQCVAEPVWVLLHRVTDRGIFESASKITDNVGFRGRDD